MQLDSGHYEVKYNNKVHVIFEQGLVSCSHCQNKTYLPKFITFKSTIDGQEVKYLTHLEQ